MTSNPESIVCKPTSWFTFRAFVILAMFGGFTVWFYIDAQTGYRKKNLVYFINKSFEQATNDFSRMDSEGKLTPEEWKKHASKQHVSFPQEASTLPVDLKLPMAWPEILHDYERMKPLQWKNLWLEYSGEMGYPESPSEQPYTVKKLQEQWYGVWVCLVITVIVLFILVRTLTRSIRADSDAITNAQGRRIPYAELKTLDLRKWDTKGLAYLTFDGPSGKGRFRIDGLTYGGFKKEQGEPAEQLIQMVRSRFSGEILEYAPVFDAPSSDASDPT